MVATTKFRMLTEQVARSLNASVKVLVVPHPLGGTDDATILSWADAAVDDALALFLGDAAPAARPDAPDSAGELTDEAVRAALAPVREIVAADGGDIVFDSLTDGTARLRLVLDTAECRECVMSREFLEDVAFDRMVAAVPQLVAVEIDDPRER